MLKNNRNCEDGWYWNEYMFLFIYYYFSSRIKMFFFYLQKGITEYCDIIYAQIDD